MKDKPLILAIDQGTTSSRAMIFAADGRAVAAGQHAFAQHYPADGWVEHDPEEIWQTTLRACRDASALSIGHGAVVAIGIACQRETTVLWERASGRAIHNAIVWQDRRAAPECERLARAGVGEIVRQKTGLALDAYFSAAKIAWILDHVPDARRRAEAGELAFGNIDAFLIWRLTGGRQHLTDATCASRTLLFDIHAQCWDAALLEAFEVPDSVLPAVQDCAADYGVAEAGWFGRQIPLCGVAGDQQAALFGQACFQPGMLKITYGTGAFMVMNTGATPAASKNRLLSTVGYRLDGQTTYALEGSIFNAGTAIQWLRDELRLFAANDEIHALIAATHGNHGVYMVPAFTGLGAPHWDARARAAIVGITRDTARGHLVRAALEAVCYQTRDLRAAMQRDAASAGITAVAGLRVDGGMVVNDWMLKFLADLLEIAVERPAVVETTALGVAYLAGLQCGMFTSLEQIAALWHRERTFTPAMQPAARAPLIAGWDEALRRVKSEE